MTAMRWTLALLLGATALAGAQRPDTVVRRADRPAHSGVATLRRELTIGSAAGAEHYILGAIADVAVGAKGTIYVWDRSVPAIRMYDAAGKFVKTIGGKGAGPGEYATGAALALARNGNLLMWDPGNARVNVYTASGDVVTSWPTMGRGGAASGRALLTVDTSGVAYIRSVIIEERSRTVAAEVRTGWIRFSADGRMLDTMFAPPMPKEGLLTAASGSGQFSTLVVPFMPSYNVTLSPMGYFVTGSNGRIALDLNERGKPVVSIRREIALPPVSARERDSARAAMTEHMKEVQPNWSWNGPEIPKTKPAFTHRFIGDDGRIWIQLSEGPRRMEDSTAADRGEEMMIIQTRPGVTRAMPWSCPTSGWTLFDVYEPRGTYVGQVRVPERVDPIVMRGDYIWGVTCDDDDVPSVGRYRILWR